MGKVPVPNGEKRIMRTLVTGVILTVATGCGAGQQIVEKQLTELNTQLTQLRKNQATMSVTMEDLETRLFLVQDELDTARNGSPQARRRMNDLPVVRIQPQHGPESVFDPRANERNQIAQRDDGVLEYDQLTDSGRVVRAGGPSETAGHKTVEPPMRRTSPPPVKQEDRDAKALYSHSYEHLKARRYENAVTGFTEFVERFPNHSYADNAVYWMGECYYARGLWLRALNLFQQVISSYPLGNKSPDAMLKLGLCHHQLRNYSQARDVLTQLTQIYTDNPVAKIAKTRLEQLP